MMTLVLSLLASLAVQVSTQKQDQTLDTEGQIREVLEQYPVAVRVYRDYIRDPASYKLFYVKTDGLLLKFDDLRSVVPDLTDRSVIAVLDTDQDYSQVRQVLERALVVAKFRPGGQVHLGPLERPFRLDTVTFIDGQGTPIPRAQIEVWAELDPDEQMRVLLGRSSTDTAGKTRGLPCRGDIILYLNHPSYWPVMMGFLGHKPEGIPVIQLPMAPRDYQGPGLVSGKVVDTSGRPTAGVGLLLVDMTIGPEPTSAEIRWYWPEVLSDDDGRFGIYSAAKDVVDRVLHLRPPVDLGLLPEGMRIGPLSRADMAVTLRSAPTGKTYCTFKFIGPNGQVVGPEESSSYSLEVSGPGKVSSFFSYEQFKLGLELQVGSFVVGRLTAGRGILWSGPAKVPTDGPAELVLRFDNAKVYEGRVLYANTGQPASGIYVLVNHRLSGKPTAELTEQDWQVIRVQAVAEQQGSLETLCQLRDRVIVTDQEGRFQIRFMHSPPNWAASFTPITAGFRSRTRDTTAQFSSYVPRVGGDAQPIKIEFELVPDRPMPRFVFLDESGPVTDPNLLAKVNMEIEYRNGRWISFPFSGLSVDNLQSGTYTATAIWGGKVYQFAPVEIGDDWPEEIIFRSIQVKGQITRYRGQVLHGIAGLPLSGVIVFSTDAQGPKPADPPVLEPQQWQAIHKTKVLGPDVPAILPFKTTCNLRKVTRTDHDGVFEIDLSPAEIGHFTELFAVEQDYLPASIRLHFPVVSGNDPLAKPIMRSHEPDPSGLVRLPPILLFPAATVRIHPLMAELDDPYEGRIRVVWQAADYQKEPWLPYIYPGLSVSGGVRIWRPANLLANQDQAFQVLAGVDVEIQIAPRRAGTYTPIKIGPVRLEQGQVLDLGRYELSKGIPVTVKVVDAKGWPVMDIQVSYSLSNRVFGVQGRTDTNGALVLHLPPRSSGEITATYSIDGTSLPEKQSIPFAIGGREDTGKEFTIYLPVAASVGDLRP